MMEAMELLTFVSLIAMLILWAMAMGYSWSQCRRVRRALRDLELAYRENKMLKRKIRELETR